MHEIGQKLHDPLYAAYAFQPQKNQLFQPNNLEPAFKTLYLYHLDERGFAKCLNHFSIRPSP